MRRAKAFLGEAYTPRVPGVLEIAIEDARRFGVVKIAIEDARRFGVVEIAIEDASRWGLLREIPETRYIVPSHYLMDREQHVQYDSVRMCRTVSVGSCEGR